VGEQLAGDEQFPAAARQHVQPVRLERRQAHVDRGAAGRAVRSEAEVEQVAVRRTHTDPAPVVQQTHPGQFLGGPRAADRQPAAAAERRVGRPVGIELVEQQILRRGRIGVVVARLKCARDQDPAVAADQDARDLVRALLAGLDPPNPGAVRSCGIERGVERPVGQEAHDRRVPVVAGRHDDPAIALHGDRVVVTAERLDNGSPTLTERGVHRAIEIGPGNHGPASFARQGVPGDEDLPVPLHGRIPRGVAAPRDRQRERAAAGSKARIDVAGRQEQAGFEALDLGHGPALEMWYASPGVSPHRRPSP
jgi:hypothetical protein